MFHKIIKRGHRKVSKSDANEAAVFGHGASAYRNSGSVSTSNITVNHASRTTDASSVANSQQQSGGSANGAGSERGSVVESMPVIVETLPLFRDVPVSERQNLFLRKLRICCILFDFSDTLKSIREKETKRLTLIELVDFIQSGSSKITENVQEEMIRMISINIFRCLPPASHENTGAENTDPEEEEPYIEPSWPHLQIVYELLLRYVVSSDTDTKIAKRYIDHSFVLKLLDLFDSEDPREREYLKTILHRIYGKFMVHRPFIRKAINNIFYRFIFETERHSGIGELLEILGSIINGFALPMKEEHKLFLVRALIPLHKPKAAALYHQQLSYCITQFVEKDYKLADTVIRGLLKYWPVTNCQKEVLFLGELEEVLELTQSAEFQRCMVPLFRQIGRCLNSSHFQDFKTGRKIGGGHKADRLYYLDGGGSTVALQTSVTPLQWHCRLDHPSLKSLKLLVSSLSHLSSLQCESCQYGKHHWVSFNPRVDSCMLSPFALVHSDIWGPLRFESYNGYGYFVVFVDDCSKMTLICLMKEMGELLSIFQKFHVEVYT